MIADNEAEEMVDLLKNEEGVLDKKCFRALNKMKIESN